MKDKTVAITGATSGLGRATALQLAQKGASVVIIARSKTKANEIIKEIEKEGGKGQSIISDLSSMKDTKEAAESITYAVKRLDVLINNAGAHFPNYIETSEGFESTLALNYLSPFLLTHHLIEQMEQTSSEYGEARIINISSVMHKGPINWDDLNFKDTTYSSTSAYYQSKHLLTSFTYYLSRQLKETGITVNCIHPGFVKTAVAQSDYPFPMNIIVPIVGFFIGEFPEQAADTPVWLALSNEAMGINGEYVHHRKVKKSWPPTRDENAQRRLYNVTQSMLGEWL
ncbi:MAG: SDR family NAD(P)-dependent oxidoreductase [Desulfobacterales bacterium]|jgi:NAD(P)-dependent dehydrogenase (short-subunit alcohol dehydrogenase family)